MKFYQIAVIVIIWRLALSIVTFSAPTLVPYQPSFPYSEAILEPLGPKALYSWANFDGVHYLTIISKGYEGTGSIQAFFPIYPLLVKALTALIGNPILAGILISTTSLTFALYFLQKLLVLDQQSKLVGKVISLILFFPTSFFFTALYTESFFFMLVCMSFYYARKNKFVTAALIAAIASATRITGIMLLPALLIEYLDQTKKITSIKSHLKNILSISMSASGLLVYMAYLKTTFNDALLFLHVQSQFGSGREVDRLVMLYQVFYRYLKMLISVQKNSLVYYTVVSEFFMALLFLIILILALKYTRKSYVVFAALSYLIPTLTGTFTSMPRYLLILFPAYIVLAKILPTKFCKLFLVLSGILLIINTLLFIQGYWVA